MLAHELQGKLGNECLVFSASVVAGGLCFLRKKSLQLWEGVSELEQQKEQQMSPAAPEGTHICYPHLVHTGI